MLTPCTQIDYSCDGKFAIYNSSTGPPPSSCAPWAYLITATLNFTGPLSLPSITTAGQVTFQGTYPWLTDNGTVYKAATMSNVTSISLPDLVWVSGVFEVSLADKIVSLDVSKLNHVEDTLELDLSGSSPPSIDLEFPSLYKADGIILTGNIDIADFPALNYTSSINITSTGNLDCEALAKQVLNTTPYVTPHSPVNYTVVCNSKKSSITTRRLGGTSTSSSKSGGRNTFGVCFELMIMMCVVSGLLYTL